MATKSFQTDFKFTSKSGHAFINALENSKRVDIGMSQPVNDFDKKNSEQIHSKFDNLVRSKKE